jgi:tetratricopeptide (TPR) repeat protein
LNEQNLQGIAAVARVLRNAEKAPLLLPVATPVPNLPREKDGPLKERFQRAKGLLGVGIKNTIGYSSAVSLKEHLVTWSGGGLRLQFEYHHLANAIKEANPNGLDYLLKETESALEAFDLARAEEMARALEIEYPDRPDAWIQIAEWHRINKDIEGYEKALRKALDLDPNGLDVFRKLETLLRTQNRDEATLALATGLLELKDGLTDESRRNAAFTLGEISMRLGKVIDAVSAYSKAMASRVESNDEEVDAPASDLAVLFNSCEARRRAGDNPPPLEWRKVVRAYENSASGADSSGTGIRLNQIQAMHIAYALAGDPQKAESLLREVGRLAENASPRERIFSVATYRHMSRDEFLEINSKMLQALENGELWDGFEIR